MEQLIGSLSVATVAKAIVDKQELIDHINCVIKPQKPVTVDSVYLGVLLAASNQVNLQGGCFQPAELERLAELIVDAPVMVGHKKQELPIGRIFKGEVIYEKEAPWLRAYFYWHRGQENADSLKTNIDAGIYKECSLGFLYGKPECCICRQDMRHCRHRLHESVRLGDREVKAFYFYKQIEKVLEVSLVYRGAVEGTKVTSLAAASEQPNVDRFDPFWRLSAEAVFDLTQINSSLDGVMIEPLYRGVWLEITCVDGKLTAVTQNGSAYHHPVIDELRQCSRSGNYQIIAQLIPTKGASRLPVRTLCRSNGGQVSPQCSLSLVDLYSLDRFDLRDKSIRIRKQLLNKVFQRTLLITPAPYYRCRFIELEHRAFAKGSGEGLRVIDLDPGADNRAFEIRRKRLLKGMVSSQTSPQNKKSYTIVFGGGDDSPVDTIHQYSLNAAGHLLADGSIVWGELRQRTTYGFDYFDHTIGELVADSVEVVKKLTSDEVSNSFSHYVDSNRDHWIDIHCQGEAPLIRIACLSVPLLQSGRKFRCELIDHDRDIGKNAGRVSLVDRGKLAYFTRMPANGMTLKLEGKILTGRYVISPARFGKEGGFLFFKESGNDGQE